MSETRSKYGAVRCACTQGGTAHQHDSRGERDRCFVLHTRQARGEITGLLVHGPVYRLEVNGLPITRYTPDWTYFEGADGCGGFVVEDFKAQPTRTRDYLIRKKLLRALHGLEIRESSAKGGDGA